jgi:signal transduction histidine kinase
MSQAATSSPDYTSLSLFEGTGEMATLMRAYNWQDHPLGNPAHWPESLKTTLRLMLQSSFPMFIWWSKDLYMFHNDAYLPALGKKHPRALGASAREMWAEIWGDIGEVVKGVLEEGKPFYAQDLLLYLERKGFSEETYWTFSYSPAPNDAGGVGGVFCACSETTSMVLGQRRLRIIKDIADATVQVKTVEEASQLAGNVLSGNRADIPYSLIYVLSSEGTTASLLSQSGALPPDLQIRKVPLLQSNSQDPWQLTQVLQSRKMQLLDQPLAQGPHLVLFKGVPVKKAVVFPILKPGEDKLIGFFVAGISPRLDYDADYQNFHQLLTGQIATSLASIQAREEAHRQQEELINLFEQAPVAIAILDGPEHVVELANPGICEIWGRRQEQVMALPILEALPEIKGQGIKELLEGVYTTGITRSFSEFPIKLLRNGLPEPVYVDFIYYPFRNSRGLITGIIVIAVEVTRQVEIRQEIEAKNEELLAINADLDNFVYSASHDLKGPILNIEGLMNMLPGLMPDERLQAPEADHVIRLIFRSVDRLKATIADLAEVSKVQKEALEEVGEVGLAEVVKDVVSDLQLPIQESGATLSIELQDCTIRFSPKNLRSIVYNLLSNAIKYKSPERLPHIRLSCRTEGDYLLFSVQDNGLGMNLKYEDKIFSMFKRLHTHVEGSGVGLYIVKRIVENAGGRIVVDSTEGVGSTFTIYLKRR